MPKSRRCAKVKGDPAEWKLVGLGDWPIAAAWSFYWGHSRAPELNVICLTINLQLGRKGVSRVERQSSHGCQGDCRFFTWGEEAGEWNPAAFNGVQCVVLVGRWCKFAQGNQEHGLRSLERRWCQKNEDELLIRWVPALPFFLTESTVYYGTWKLFFLRTCLVQGIRGDDTWCHRNSWKITRFWKRILRDFS